MKVNRGLMKKCEYRLYFPYQFFFSERYSWFPKKAFLANKLIIKHTKSFFPFGIGLHHPIERPVLTYFYWLFFRVVNFFNLEQRSRRKRVERDLLQNRIERDKWLEEHGTKPIWTR